MPPRSKRRRMLVFVLRHGEREDEVVDDETYLKLSRKQKVDPPLTTEGYLQASDAWEQLVDALSSCPDLKRVCIFSSPLQRAIGTAMMVSTTMAARERNWQAVLPIRQQNDDQERESEPQPSLPEQTIAILVWNGLCDCAAQVNRLGGHGNAIARGYIPCAATPESSMEAFAESEMNLVWQQVKQIARMGESTNALAGETSLPIQFWKLGEDMQLNPMTPQLYEQGVPRDEMESQANGEVTISRQKEAPIDQVVRMAIDAGCQACIVVSHREEIRDLYKNRCGYHWSSMYLDYCCIGQFGVSLAENDGGSTLHWRLHDVAPGGSLTGWSVQKMHEEPLTHISCFDPQNKTCSLLWKMPGDPVIALCEVVLIKESWPHSKVVSIAKCSLTHRRRSGHTVHTRDGFEPVVLEIARGNVHFVRALGSLKGQEAYGTISVVTQTDPLHVSHHGFVLQPLRQKQLPCPPQFVDIEVQVSR